MQALTGAVGGCCYCGRRRLLRLDQHAALRRVRCSSYLWRAGMLHLVLRVGCRVDFAMERTECVVALCAARGVCQVVHDAQLHGPVCRVGRPWPIPRVAVAIAAKYALATHLAPRRSTSNNKRVRRSSVLLTTSKRLHQQHQHQQHSRSNSRRTRIIVQHKHNRWLPKQAYTILLWPNQPYNDRSVPRRRDHLPALVFLAPMRHDATYGIVMEHGRQRELGLVGLRNVSMVRFPCV